MDEEVQSRRSLERDLRNGLTAGEFELHYLARGMGMTATAEGVETDEQRDRIAAEGCTEMQGYLFSRPVPPSEIERRFLWPEGRTGRDRIAAP